MEFPLIVNDERRKVSRVTYSCDKEGIRINKCSVYCMKTSTRCRRLMLMVTTFVNCDALEQKWSRTQTGRKRKPQKRKNTKGIRTFLGDTPRVKLYKCMWGITDKERGNCNNLHRRKCKRKQWDKVHYSYCNHQNPDTPSLPYSYNKVNWK